MSSIKVVHISNFELIPKRGGAGFFGVPLKISNGFTRIGHNVINFNDRNISRSLTIFQNRKTGARTANRKLIEVVRQFQPDVVLFGHADTITPRTVEILREVCPRARLAQWNVDPLFEPDNVARIKRKIGHVDQTFVSTAGPDVAALAEDRYRVAFLPNPVDPGIERARNFERPRSELAYDLLYAVGNPRLPRFHAGERTTPADLAGRLGAALPGARLHFPGVHTPPISGASYEDALASSAMGLNISRRNDIRLYSSDRVAHLAGSGILVFMDRAAGFDEFFSADELAFYSSEAELVERIRYFMNDDRARRAVAGKGWSAYRRLFDCTRVASYMLGVILDEFEPDAFAWCG